MSATTEPLDPRDLLVHLRHWLICHRENHTRHFGDSDQSGHPHGYAGVVIPEWDVRQRLDEIEASLDASVPHPNPFDFCADCGKRMNHELHGTTAEPCEVRTVQREASLESRVEAWVRSRIGDDHMHSRERAMRLLEEAVELAQAEGISLIQVVGQVGHVMARTPGEPKQEAAGVAVCLLGWCAANGVQLLDIARAEIERIEAKPLDQIRGSLARKADADLVTVAPQCGGAE